MNYLTLVKDISLLREVQAECRRQGRDVFDLPSIVRMKRDIRRALQSCHDQLAIPLSGEWRVLADELGEYRTEYRIFNDSGLTDAEVDDLVESMRQESYSMYDCTGMWVTRHLHWSRQPAGIVVIHSLALDI